jgi:hypothetical protein
MKITERSVANNFYCEKTPYLAICNSHVHAAESDLLLITRAHFTYDYEIKLSRADYMCELRAKTGSKRHKHEVLRSAYEKTIKPSELRWCPNYYAFITPEGMLKRGDPFPHYAGLIEFRVWNSRLLFRSRRPMRRLHSQKLSAKALEDIARGLMYRCFDKRLRVE